jgi:hypothetical protein
MAPVPRKGDVCEDLDLSDPDKFWKPVQTTCKPWMHKIPVMKIGTFELLFKMIFILLN